MPKFFGELFYVLIFKFLQSMFVGKKYELWYRHSLKLGYLQTFISDIDLTLFFYDAAQTKKIYRKAKLLKVARKLCPIIGETNIYPYTFQETIFKNINYYEALKDPFLYNKIKSKCNPSKIALAVFWARAIDSDKNNLISYARARVNKWTYNNNYLDKEEKLDTTNLSMQATIAVIPKLLKLNKTEADKLEAELINYFMCNKDGFDEFLEWQLCFFPHKLYKMRAHAYKLNSLQMNILEEQVRWEIFGALTQNYNFNSNKIFIEHLEGLQKIVINKNLIEELTTTISLLKDANGPTAC
ncbi:MAG: hypothetical protein IPM57_06100 [Oligoflexia bacterium]|nr:hypothetical protein [Oligoflexia bacterium]